MQNLENGVVWAVMGSHAVIEKMKISPFNIAQTISVSLPLYKSVHIWNRF